MRRFARMSAARFSHGAENPAVARRLALNLPSIASTRTYGINASRLRAGFGQRLSPPVLGVHREAIALDAFGAVDHDSALATAAASFGPIEAESNHWLHKGPILSVDLA